MADFNDNIFLKAALTGKIESPSTTKSYIGTKRKAPAKQTNETNQARLQRDWRSDDRQCSRDERERLESGPSIYEVEQRGSWERWGVLQQM